MLYLHDPGMGIYIYIYMYVHNFYSGLLLYCFHQYIDMQELDKVLSDTVGMFTQKQLDEIMKEIDQDDSNTLDFFEVLTVSRTGYIIHVLSI